ncbi:Inositol 2-dehydrogenase [Symmachiella dynata]|uniref:Gfo/Idh/MocA family protein n=1 Tax=Symmachiella dynata TaxID=2527995 RepID=UPI00118D2CAA|nr:Gfo/Idh/MocA family oxidoreductase [Symmachiella dynata]QDT51952.1 Inositol 2-dehydrogenase [Symmachiella dynata]
MTTTRREFLRTSAALGTGILIPYTFTTGAETKPRSPNERPRIGSIGMRYQGSVIARKAAEHGDIVAIADVDREIADKAQAEFGGKADIYENYRDLLSRDDIDVVTIGAPDHWHASMLIDACRAGKDVYCEKPLTLTIDEGKTILKAVKETGAVVQVGTWQRSDSRFRLACELVQQGRIGKLQRVSIVLGKNVVGGPFAVTEPPAHFNWDLWQGPTPDVPYIKERSHYTFRWWYEYSGGQMTDWGAHHLDIAQWGMGQQHSGPVQIEGTADFPHTENGYNVATNYHAAYRYDDGVELVVADNGRNGVMFEGDEGRIFVNRGTVSGKPVEDLKTKPLNRGDFALYGHDNLDRPERAGKLDAIINHMGNFFDCVVTRETPISDVASQHRSVSVCHLGNIAMRLGRKLQWDPQVELFVDDEEANRWLSRDRRAGFELDA